MLVLDSCANFNCGIFWDSGSIVLAVLLFKALDYTVHLITLMM